MPLDLITNLLTSPQLYLLIFIVVTLKLSIIFVPQNEAWLVERFGKYRSTKEAGLLIVLVLNEASKKLLSTFHHNRQSQKTILALLSMACFISEFQNLIKQLTGLMIISLLLLNQHKPPCVQNQVKWNQTRHLKNVIF